nr:protein phosphatase 2C domain-containing protein [Pseudenhygromyxa sp. WMMC2535]
MRVPVLVPVAGGTAIAYTAPSPVPADRLNEDGVAIFDLGPEAAVLAVADGVGGHGRGDEAARTALLTIASALEEIGELAPGPEGEAPPADLREPVMAAIERANSRLVARAGSLATTLVVATIHRGELRCYTVGDSELLVVGQRGKLKLRTIPHSPVGYARESGLLGEAEALLHDERHLLSNVLGMEGMHMAATSGIQLAARDTVLLGSDGVFDNLYHDEIIELVRAGEPYATAEQLLGRLRGRMAGLDPEPEIPCKPDDLSFVLFRPQAPRPETHERAERAERERIEAEQAEGQGSEQPAAAGQDEGPAGG